jgi:hypothetical protein
MLNFSQFALYGLAVIIAGGIGFFLWALLCLQMAKRQSRSGTAHSAAAHRMRH